MKENTLNTGESPKSVTKKSWKKVAPYIGIAIIVVVVITIVVLWKPERAGNDLVNDLVTEPTETIVGQQPNLVRKTLNNNGCGDEVCGKNEAYSTCEQDCLFTCGDGIVQDDENWQNCQGDLLSKCGDGICNNWEHYRYCPQDCEECIVDDAGKYDGPNECPPSPRWV